MARKLWIHVTDAFSITETIHQPLYHATACLTFGHVLPIDDFAIPRMTGIMLKSFELYDPHMNVTPLSIPSMDTFSSRETDNGLIIERGDLAAHKVIFGEKAVPGAYQFAATSPEFFVTQYTRDGKTVWDPRPMSDFGPEDNIEDSVKVLVNAKAIATNRQWSTPKPLGWPLEIIPATPLDHVLPGMPVTFEVLHMGKPFGCTQSEMEFLIAASNTYAGEGGGDPAGFFLSAYIMDGKARISFPTAGEWVISVFVNKPVIPGGCFDAYKEQCRKVFYSSNLTVNVKAI